MALILLLQTTAHILSFPAVPDFHKGKKKIKMKNLKQILLTIALVVGISITASAQNNDNRKPPPKEKPPVVPVEPKKPKDEKPKDNDKGKKPGMVFYLAENRIEIVRG